MILRCCSRRTWLSDICTDETFSAGILVGVPRRQPHRRSGI